VEGILGEMIGCVVLWVLSLLRVGFFRGCQGFVRGLG